MDGNPWNGTHRPANVAPESPARPGGAALDGRKYVLIGAAYLIVADVAVTVAYAWRMGFDRLGQQTVRLTLLCALAAFLLQGRGWARWVTVLLLAAVWAGFPFLVRDGAWTRQGLPATLPILALYTGYVIVLRGLLYSSSVRAFFAAHRARRPADDTMPPLAR